MAKNSENAGHGGEPHVWAADSLLDAIARGESVEDDQLITLLSRAHRQAGEGIPEAPALADFPGFAAGTEGEDATDNVVPIRRRLLRGAAAGGASVSSLLIAGGVAAALAVGGLGYAAYSSNQPAVNSNQGAASSDTQSTSSTAENAADGDQRATAAGRTDARDKKPGEAEKATDKDGVPKDPSSSESGSSESTSTNGTTKAPTETSSKGEGTKTSSPSATKNPGTFPFDGEHGDSGSDWVDDNVYGPLGATAPTGTTDTTSTSGDSPASDPSDKSTGWAASSNFQSPDNPTRGLSRALFVAREGAEIHRVCIAGAVIPGDVVIGIGIHAGLVHGDVGIGEHRPDVGLHDSPVIEVQLFAVIAHHANTAHALRLQ